MKTRDSNAPTMIFVKVSDMSEVQAAGEAVFGAVINYGDAVAQNEERRLTDEERGRAFDTFAEAFDAAIAAARAESVPREVRVLVETAMTLVPVNSALYTVGRAWLNNLTGPAA